jgi:hypothetical protein
LIISESLKKIINECSKNEFSNEFVDLGKFILLRNCLVARIEVGESFGDFKQLKGDEESSLLEDGMWKNVLIRPKEVGLIVKES